MNTSNNVLFNNNRHQPWDLLGDIDQFVNGLIGATRPDTGSREAQYSPAVDVFENDDAYTVRIDLAGVSTDDLDVTIDAGVLTIVADRPSDYNDGGDGGDGKIIRRERRYGRFSRSIALAEDVLEDSIAARYENGVLTLNLPKAVKKQPRKVNIVAS